MSTATLEQPTSAVTATAAEAPVVTFSKSPKGEWRLVGPVSLVVEGAVTVTKKNGKTSVENVVGVGTTFDRGGVAHRYGYLKPKAEEKPTSPASEDNYVQDDFAEYDDSDTSDTDY